jgi:hypothetical protein
MKARTSSGNGSGVVDCSIIALDKFIQATRDSGYKGTASAISELVDNSLQAGAKKIAITLVASTRSGGDNDGITISVLDDGCGMDPFTLRQALRFGGSTRFNDRRGLGRYGMGLPNASLSQARRVAVYSWQSERSLRKQTLASQRVYTSHLDVDAIADGRVQDVPRPTLVSAPPPDCVGNSGTLVLWTQCDRLDNRRVSTIARKLSAELGRRFRHYLWRHVRITINGQLVRSIDPLYLNPSAEVSGAVQFGDELVHEIRANVADQRLTGRVRIRFSELPVREWQGLPNEEKRRLGISKGAGVSIVRAGREVDYGWFFMGAKHRENYDDWWRCEIHFDPVLDEVFGITHTKQQVRPDAALLEALSPDIEAVARLLNGRARKAHLAAKEAVQATEAERLANNRERFLKRLPRKPTPRANTLMRDLDRENLVPPRGVEGAHVKYSIIERTVRGTHFFTYAYDGRRLTLVINREHPFYREVYHPLVESTGPLEKRLRTSIELMLLAAVRTEASLEDAAALVQFRLDWSDTLATLLND